MNRDSKFAWDTDTFLWEDSFRSFDDHQFAQDIIFGWGEPDNTPAQQPDYSYNQPPRQSSVENIVVQPHISPQIHCAPYTSSHATQPVVHHQKSTAGRVIEFAALIGCCLLFLYFLHENPDVANSLVDFTKNIFNQITVIVQQVKAQI